MDDYDAYLRDRKLLDDIQDDYNEIVSLLFESDGETTMTHEQVIKEIKSLIETNWMYEDLNK